MSRCLPDRRHHRTRRDRFPSLLLVSDDRASRDCARTTLRRRWDATCSAATSVEEVCARNHERATPTTHRDLHLERGLGEFLDLARIMQMQSEDAFLDLTGGTALSRRKLEGIRHNAEIVLANQSCPR